MTVRAAVEAAGAATTTQEPPLPQLVRDAIARQADVLTRILPATMDATRFEEMTLAAIKATPRLARCFETLEGRTSILYAVIQAGSVGLEVNTVAEEAYLIPREVSYKDGKNWRKRWEARMQFGYRGVQKIATRDPRVKQVVADVVMAGDHFVHRRGLEADEFEHEVIGDSDRELTHAYAMIRFHEAPAFVRVLDRAAVEKRRASSQSWQAGQKDERKRDSPWYQWEAEQWRKTAIHSILRELHLAPVEQRVLGMEGQTLGYDPVQQQLTAAGGPIDPADMPRVSEEPPYHSAVLPPGAPPPDPGPDHPPEPAGRQERADTGGTDEIEPVSPDRLRELVRGNAPAKQAGPLTRAALDAVRKHFGGQTFGTLDDVAEVADANRWLQLWIEDRDHTAATSS